MKVYKNKTTLECEMDLLIHFQDETDNDMKGSLFVFFRHTTTKDLGNLFKEITKSVVSAMDEPNVDLKFYEALKQECTHCHWYVQPSFCLRSNLIWCRHNILGYKGNPYSFISIVE